MEAKITSFSIKNTLKDEFKKQHDFSNHFSRFFMILVLFSRLNFARISKTFWVSCDNINFAKIMISLRENHYFHKIPNRNFMKKFM